MQTISTPNAPQTIGPYSQAIIQGDFIFCSGQIALDPETMTVVGSSIKEQTEQVIKNLKAVLEAGGSSLEKVIKTTVYLKNMEDFDAFNETYGSYFEKIKPARATIEVSRLPKDVLVEIECVAIL